MAARRFSGMQFAGPPSVGGMDIGAMLKLAGYGDKEGGYIDPSDQIRWMLEQAKEGRQARQFETTEGREQAKSTADIEKIKADILAGQLKGQVDVEDLKRKFAETQQSGRSSNITALADLAKAFPADKEATARYEDALAEEVPALAHAREKEAKAKRITKAGEINKAMIPIYQKGNKGVLAAQMARLEPEFQQDPELTKLLPWNRYNELWPVADATVAKAAGGAQMPASTGGGDNAVWNYLTGTHGIPQTATEPEKAPDYMTMNLPGFPSAQRDYETYGIQTPTAESVINRINNDPRYQPAEDVLMAKLKNWWNAPREQLAAATAYPSVEDLIARSQYQTPAEPQAATPQVQAPAPVAPQLPSPGSVANNYQYGPLAQAPENLTPSGAPSVGIMDLIRKLWGGGEEQRMPFTYGRPLPPSQQLPPPVAQGDLMDVLR